LCLNNIADIYQKQGNFLLAKTNFQRALDLCIEFDYQQDLALIFNNLGLILFQEKEYDEALLFFQKANQIYEKTQDQTGIAKCYDNIGAIYGIYGNISLDKKQDHYDLAFNFFHKGLELAKTLGDKLQIANITKNIGKLFQFQQIYYQSVEYYEKSFSILDELTYIAPDPDIRISARKELHKLLNDLVFVLLQLNQNNLAIAYVEHNKGREMLLQSKSKLCHSSSKYSTFIDQINKKHEEINSIEKNLFILNKEALTAQRDDLQEIKIYRKELIQKEKLILEETKILQHEIWIKFPSKGTLLPPNPLEVITKFKKEISDRWIILDYYLDKKEERLYVFVFQKGKEISVFSVSVAKIEEFWKNSLKIIYYFFF
jgi:tetratricopeptide (TPR) repeat protein